MKSSMSRSVSRWICRNVVKTRCAVAANSAICHSFAAGDGGLVLKVEEIVRLGGYIEGFEIPGWGIALSDHGREPKNLERMEG